VLSIKWLVQLIKEILLPFFIIKLLLAKNEQHKARKSFRAKKLCFSLKAPYATSHKLSSFPTPLVLSKESLAVLKRHHKNYGKKSGAVKSKIYG
jgi:hypothetical protein